MSSSLIYETYRINGLTHILNSVGSECYPYKVEVLGSNPRGCTEKSNDNKEISNYKRDTGE